MRPLITRKFPGVFDSDGKQRSDTLGSAMQRAFSKVHKPGSWNEMDSLNRSTVHEGDSDSVRAIMADSAHTNEIVKSTAYEVTYEQSSPHQ